MLGAKRSARRLPVAHHATSSSVQFAGATTFQRSASPQIFRHCFCFSPHKGRLTSLKCPVNTVALPILRFPPYSGWRRISSHAQFTQILREVFSPLSQRCLPYVQPLPVLTLRLHHEMYMGVCLIRVQNHCIPMLERELLARKL